MVLKNEQNRTEIRLLITHKKLHSIRTTRLNNDLPNLTPKDDYSRMLLILLHEKCETSSFSLPIED